MATSNCSDSDLDIVLFNTSGADDRKKCIERLLDEVLEATGPDLFVLGQENITKTKHETMCKKLGMVPKAPFNKEAGIYYHKYTGLQQRQHPKKKEKVSAGTATYHVTYLSAGTLTKVGGKLKRPSGNDFAIAKLMACVVELREPNDSPNKILLVSCHGHTLDTKLTHAEKQACFDRLIVFVERLRIQENCSIVFVGGDFDLNGEEAHRITENSFKDFDDKVSVGYTCKEENGSKRFDYVLYWSVKQIKIKEIPSAESPPLLLTVKQSPKPFDYNMILFRFAITFEAEQTHNLDIVLVNMDGDPIVTADDRKECMEHVLDEVMKDTGPNLFVLGQEIMTKKKHDLVLLKKMGMDAKSPFNKEAGIYYRQYAGSTDADKTSSTDADGGDSTDADGGDSTDADGGDSADADVGDSTDTDGRSSMNSGTSTYHVTYLDAGELRKVADEMKLEAGNDFTPARLMACVLEPREPNGSTHTILLVSWHGPHSGLKVVRKKAAFDNLIQFVEQLRLKTQCSIALVGGDFNLKAEEACKVDIIGTLNAKMIYDYTPTDDRKDRDKIDYVIYWPEDQLDHKNTTVECKTLRRESPRPFDHNIILIRFAVTFTRSTVKSLVSRFESNHSQKSKPEQLEEKKQLVRAKTNPEERNHATGSVKKRVALYEQKLQSATDLSSSASSKGHGARCGNTPGATTSQPSLQHSDLPSAAREPQEGDAPHGTAPALPTSARQPNYPQQVRKRDKKDTSSSKTTSAGSSKFVCDICGQDCHSSIGLHSHKHHKHKIV